MTSRPIPPNPPASSPPALPPGARRSHALESLANYLRSHDGLQILDFGGINQANLDFVTGLGHRLYAEDLVRSFDTFFIPPDAAGEYPAERIEGFLEQVCDFPDQSCDGALVWDALQFLPAAVAQGVLDRLYRVLAPDSYVLAFFHPDTAAHVAAPHVCRILDSRHLILAARPSPRPVQAFNTRAIERFFQRFQSVKFFLTRENLQEVIARR